MIELWITPNGLQPSHDPGHPRLEDVRAPQNVLFMADRVVVETDLGAWVIKDRDEMGVGPLPPWQLGLRPTPRNYLRVSFNPTRLRPWQIKLNERDMAILEEMGALTEALKLSLDHS
jgi:hypothetical protein